MNTMIAKVDKTYQGNDLLTSQGVHCLRASTQNHCNEPPPLSTSGRLQELLDIIDEAILLVSDCEGEDVTHRYVDSPDETKAQSITEQDEHPEADANARHGSSPTP